MKHFGTMAQTSVKFQEFAKKWYARRGLPYPKGRVVIDDAKLKELAANPFKRKAVQAVLEDMEEGTRPIEVSTILDSRGKAIVKTSDKKSK